jgi:hypothetical protein
VVLEGVVVAAGAAVLAVILPEAAAAVAFVFMVKALTVAAVQGITPLAGVVAVVREVLMEARLLSAQLAGLAGFMAAAAVLVVLLTTLAPACPLAFYRGLLGVVAQSALSGPVARDHSPQLERRTNNEFVHTN